MSCPETPNPIPQDLTSRPGTLDRFPKTPVLGVNISAVDVKQTLDVIAGWITDRTPNYICVRDVHGVVRCQKDTPLREIHNRAGLVVPDGMPLVWLSRLAGHRIVERVYGPDLMLATLAAGLKLGWRHYFYGGTAGVAARLAGKLKRSYPGLQVAGEHCPPFRPLTVEEDQRAIETINQSRADIVWVGLSTPKQERWIAAHVGEVEAPVLIGVGAAFDFNSGVKRQAPRWMQRNGLEWLFRMAVEPRRLGPRYLTTVPRFLILIMNQLFRSYMLKPGATATAARLQTSLQESFESTGSLVSTFSSNELVNRAPVVPAGDGVDLTTPV